MATNDPYDLENLISGRSRSTTQRMIEALMKQAGQPNPSLGGALGHGLALGLMGLYDKWDEQKNLGDRTGAMDAQVASMGGPGAPQGYPAAPAGSGYEPPAPQSVPMTPRPMSDIPTGPSRLAEALKGPSEMDMASKDVADSLAAQGMPVSPSAVNQLFQVESGGNPRATTGKYAGVNQAGADTFKEAGGRLGGLTYPEYKNGSLTQQAWTYPDWLQQYRIPDKLQTAGIDTGSLPPNQQYGVLQAAQFAPNGGANPSQPPPWMAAFGQGNPNVPATNTPQARVLGNTSVAAMAASPPGRAAVTQGAGVGVPQMPGTPGSGLPQPPQAVPAQPPQQTPPPILDMQRQTDMLREQYQNTTNPIAKAGIFKQLIEQQNQLRTMQMELNKSTFQKQQPGYGDLNKGPLAAQEQAAKLPYEQILKQTPTAEEQVKIDTQNKAKTNLSGTVASMAKGYMTLNGMDNAIVNSDRGTLDNLIAKGSSSPYLGQPIGAALGTKEQSVRQEINQSIPDLINNIRQATNMGVRGIDTQKELDFYSQMASNPANDLWSNLSALYKLDKNMGSGDGLKSVLSPQDYARVQKGAAALEDQYKAQEKAQGGQSSTTFSDGATATNPQTGQKIIRRNGQWVPM